MSAAIQVKGGVAAAAAARPAAGLDRAVAPGRARRLPARLGTQWLSRAAWTVGRTGRAGLVGLALLLAAALFLVSTHLQVAAEVEAQRAELEVARRRAPAAVEVQALGPVDALRALPARGDVPAILRQLFDQAARARLDVDTARYEISAMSASGVVRYQVAFPVTGSYPQIRGFIDAALATMPAVALSGLALERRTIADGNVEAQLRMTIYTRGSP